MKLKEWLNTAKQKSKVGDKRRDDCVGTTSRQEDYDVESVGDDEFYS